jgi:hypothetical protein
MTFSKLIAKAKPTKVLADYDRTIKALAPGNLVSLLYFFVVVHNFEVAL